MRYNLATLAELRTFRPIPYVLDIDGEEHRFDASTVAVGNGSSFGGGLRIAEGALLDDGLLDVVVIGPISKVELVRTYPKLFKGTHVHHPEYHHYPARTVTVAAPGVVAYADGERIGALPLTVEVVPQALRVLVP
jgi:diacylglycerol kinase (ATP)